jgi:hypothetical protein
VCLNTSIQPKNQPKVAEHETKSPQKRASEAIHGQRHSFLLTASAQTPFIQRFPNLIATAGLAWLDRAVVIGIA